MRKWEAYSGVVVVALFAVTPVLASNTKTYTYDALGRLTASSRAGGPNNGTAVSIGYDAAGNRANYTVAGVAGPPTISIGDASVTEGGNLVFTVTRSGSASTAVSANWSSADGTATAGSDYTAASGTISFAAGEVSKTITVTTIYDTIAEPTETMTVTLTSPTGGAVVGSATATGSILDNNTPNSTLAISNTSATEGGNLAFTITRTGTTFNAASASWTTGNGTALDGSDYVAGSGTVSFAAGETTKAIAISTIDDAAPEPTETMMVTLSGPSAGTTLGASTGVGTIADNDPLATFVIGNASVTEGGNLLFTVTRSGNTAFPVSVSYATADGTAVAGADYVPISGALSFATGQTTATIIVHTIDDVIVEPTETLNVTLTSPSNGATISTPTGMGSILDNDLPSWSATLTAGSVTYCSYVCWTNIGYMHGSFGSMSNTSFNGSTITYLYSISTLGTITVQFSMSPASNTWNTINVPGVGTLSRSGATYNSGVWSWTVPTSVSSGTVVIQ